MNKYLLILLPCLLAVVSLWRLWEQDIYWQIRMGEEFLNTFSVFRIDNWSYTAAGFHDTNFWWLPTVIFYWVEKIGSDGGLVLFRGVLEAAYLIFCAAIFDKYSKKNPLNAAALLFTMILVFIANCFRFQLRPDFMIGVLMAATVWLWSADFSAKNKIIWSIAICLVASNCHMGPQVLVIFTAITFLCTTELPAKTKLLLSILLGSTFFMTPAHFHSIPLLLKTLSYGTSSESMRNYDWDSFGVEMFNLKNWGMTGYAWLCLGVLAIMGLRTRAGTIFDRWQVRGLFLFLMALTIYRTRGITYVTPLAIAYAAQTTSHLLSTLEKRQAALLSIMGLLLLFAHLRYWPHPWGIGLDEWVYPSRGVNLLKQIQPKPNIFHDPSLGNYLVWNLKTYPVLVDTRQYPFEEIGRRLADAGKSPETMVALTDELKINVVFLPIPKMILTTTGVVDTVRPFFPKDKWALIYFDNHYMLFLRRIPEHQAAIDQYEYSFLTPQFPSFYAADASAPTERVTNELKRCLAMTADNLYCGFKTAFLNKQGLLGQSRVFQFAGYLREQIETAYFFGKKDEAKFLEGFL